MLWALVMATVGLGWSAVAWAQTAIAHAPAALQSGSTVLFSVDEPRAVDVQGTWLEHPIRFTRTSKGGSWVLLAGIDVEQAPGEYAIEVTVTLADQTTRHLSAQIVIGKAAYRTASIRVAEKFLAPDPATLERIAEDKAAKDEAFARDIPEILWSGRFAPPVRLSATDSFGTRRTFNGTLASIHRGTDFRASTGTPVLASNDGLVTLARPMFYEGNFVVVDHGQRFQTMYMHLSRIDVQAGDHVHKGQRLGLSGATGRVTGPHLHLAVRWQGSYLDPVKLMAMPLPVR